MERRPLEPANDSIQLFADLTGLPEAEVLRWGTTDSPLSFDPARKGFWIGGRDTISFIPVADGMLDTAHTARRILPSSFLGPNGYLRMVFFDPVTGRLFVTGPTALGFFLALDQALNVVSNYSSLVTDRYIPWTLTRLAEQLPTSYEQTVPVVAKSPGRNGTYWTSDLWLFNPSAEPTSVTVRRLAASGQQVVELPAHGSRRLDDILTLLGGGPSGDGSNQDALLLSSPYRWGEQVVAASRTFTPSDDPAERAAGGTMGQAILAVPGGLGYTNHLPYIALSDQEPYIGKPSELVLDRRDPERYRHNLGIVNTGDEPVHITLTWAFSEAWVPYYQFPVPDGEVVITVPPHQLRNENIEAMFPPGVRDVWPANIAVTGDRPAILWSSMVDNRTGDATFVPFTNYHRIGAAATRMAVPVVAHAPGEKATVWVTDFYGRMEDAYDEESYGEDIRAYFHPADPAACGGVAAGGEITGLLQGVPALLTGKLPPPFGSLQYWRTIFPDVLHLLEPCRVDTNVRGALEMRTASWTTGYSRTYTTRADGGTYGEMLPIYPEGGWPVQHFAGLEIGARFRINLGMFNGDREHDIVHRLQLYASDGTLVAERELTLHPWASVQDRIERLLGLEVGSLPAGTYGLSVIPLDDLLHGVEGRSWAYVSMVDNVTGDPTNWW